MIVLTRREQGLHGPRVVAVFGVGLIGDALITALRSSGPWHQQDQPITWTDPIARVTQLRAIEDSLASSRAGCLHLVWSAGRAGFGASRSETEAELSTFQEVLAVAERLASRCPSSCLSFHLLSSAGGLFEGQRHVERTAVPKPRRPYGELKLRQEQMLASSSARLVGRVYRLTSVYGCAHSRHRQGLIPTLVLNGLRHRVSSIVGRATTLRDFTWVEDVASFIAADLLTLGPDCLGSTYVLASGLPTSILEVREAVEGILGRSLHLTYSLEPGNCEDITFSRDLLPSRWFPSDLKTNIKRVYYEAMRSGFGVDSDRRL
jgi:UDP-glucose 4-epimerase